MRPKAAFYRGLMAASMWCTIGATADAQDRRAPDSPPPAPMSPRAVGVVPIQKEAPAGSAGMFVGVNKFTDDASITPLNYAVDDAIAQAYLFVVELKLIPADHCYLLLSGDANSPEAIKHLKELADAGAKVKPATSGEILEDLVDVQSLAQHDEDLLVFSFSTHGFEINDKAYIVPANVRRRVLDLTAIKVQTLEETLSASKAGKRILFVDACRDKAVAGGKDISGMGDAFRKAFSEARGQAILSSCSAGERSYEDDKLHHGVFTYYLLEALHGQAGSDSTHKGLITLRTVDAYVKENVAKHSKGMQSPNDWGSFNSTDIPLAEKATFTEFRDAVKKVSESLRNKIEIDGPFTAELWIKLSNALAALDPAAGVDQPMLAKARAFAEGKIDSDLFVPWLKERMKPQAGEDPSAMWAIVNAEATTPEQKEQKIKLLLKLVDVDAANARTAMLRLGDAYRDGKMIAANPRQAMEWYQKSASAGSAEAMDKLAWVYEDGAGVTKDQALAFTWFQKAADGGSVKGMTNLGWCYQYGYGSAENRDLAAKCYLKAADAGSADAMYDLGTLYDEGSGTIARDLRTAKDWYQKAASAGNADAAARLKELAS